ncbi:small, acid-soluble spore protein, alpha/beta type [Desulfosporosinus acidiphilus SJ4]|uniref:Small, acid-soluble spore protein, alpha/beta type n=1 Tax=Desulfosporosinus acidiphilus (strain DSM 22704 / JCM 16185 / SJ4) TaxID=646529 RepID=I4D9B8_DESAJ|nr:alpha/beta-type small acid-soluble spore protein [Desulfosporosinus acidiphilus]AFM42392.1 small, acid-soluble spore protein, alpha/beta type [Desulfosporosinus acidiphilus SJ4]
MSRNTPEVPESESQLDKLKWEVAEELQLDDDIEDKGFANMTTREVGQIGGNMVRKMINFAEKEMANEGSDIMND